MPIFRKEFFEIMKIGNKASYVVHFTDEAIKEYNMPSESMVVNFEAIESGAFRYGNHTSVVMTSDEMEQKRCYDTRYYVGSFDECCKDIINDYFGANVKSINQLS